MLYDRFRSVLFGLLIRILHDHTEAEDVLQEVFMQVWQRADRFDSSRGKVSTWLILLARSRGIDRLRSLRKHSLIDIEGAGQRLIGSESGGNSVIERERVNFVRKALSELPEEQRNVLLLAFFEGFSHSEIAVRTDTPLGTVKTRVRAAMTKLQKSLAVDLSSSI